MGPATKLDEFSKILILMKQIPLQFATYITKQGAEGGGLKAVWVISTYSFDFVAGAFPSLFFLGGFLT